MDENFEPVIEVHDYYDGPRTGIAHFRGKPFAFRSRMLDTVEYKGDFETVDIFELSPIDQTMVAPILAHAVFRTVPSGKDGLVSGQLRPLEVQWQVIEPE